MERLLLCFGYFFVSAKGYVQKVFFVESVCGVLKLVFIEIAQNELAFHLSGVLILSSHQTARKMLTDIL